MFPSSSSGIRTYDSNKESEGYREWGIMFNWTEVREWAHAGLQYFYNDRKCGMICAFARYTNRRGIWECIQIGLLVPHFSILYRAWLMMLCTILYWINRYENQSNVVIAISRCSIWTFLFRHSLLFSLLTWFSNWFGILSCKSFFRSLLTFVLTHSGSPVDCCVRRKRIESNDSVHMYGLLGMGEKNGNYVTVGNC